eukprot:Hpha_TRINITY_DN16926_c1_g1::TRINITY_DN16926_c1_g1_i1::g.52732::m.52732
MRCARLGLAVLAAVWKSDASSLCYSQNESKAHTSGEVCASIWNKQETRGWLRLRESGRCDQCGQCAPTGPLQYAPERGQGWTQISSAYGCSSNGEGIGKYQEVKMDLEADVNDCLKACEEDPKCWAVDWRCSVSSRDQRCIFFERACESPNLRPSGGYGAASYRIVPKGEDSHSRPIAFHTKSPEKLEVKVVDCVYGDPELKSLEYCGEHKTYVVHGVKNTIRLEGFRSDEEWKRTACWRVKLSHWYNGWYSFESNIKEGWFLRRNGWKVEVGKESSNANWRSAASWHLRYPVTEQALCEQHTDSAGLPNCVWSANIPKKMPGADVDPDAEPTGFYWGEDGDAADGDVATYVVGGHSFAPFGPSGPTFSEPDTQVEGVNVEFEEGYEEGHDHLHLDPEYAAERGITMTWDKSAGSLSLKLSDGKTKSATEWGAIIAQVHFESESTELHHRKIVWNFGDDSFFADETGHFYKQIKRRQPLTWFEARDDCESRMLLGQKGYLATITSEVENEVLSNRIHATGWIGACDGPGTSGKKVGRKCASTAEAGCEDYEGGTDEYGKEGEWRWCTGPESVAEDPADETPGMMFWKGTARAGIGAWPTSTTDRVTEDVVLGHGYDAMFNNWNGNQPDNWRGDEDCVQVLGNGRWNDISCTNKRSIRSFVCEWNGGGSLREAHGSVSVKVKACLSKPCNYQNQRDCQSDTRKSNPKSDDGPGGCTWYASEGEGLGACYPRCENEYYGALCDRHCNNQLTCSGNGRCDAEGHCKCGNGWDGPNCNWKCHRCTGWGDPHYTNFAGVKFDHHGVNKQYLVFSRPAPCPVAKGPNATECHDFVVYAQHYRCSGNEKRPIGCMDQITLRDVHNGWALQMEVEDRDTPETEHGKMWITETGKDPKYVDALSLQTPHLFIDESLTGDAQLKRKPIVMLTAKKVSNKKFKFVFELPSNGQMHTKIEIQQDNSWKAPYMNVYVDHCGPLCATQPDASGNAAEVSCVYGLCNGDCGDMGKWRTGVSKDCTDAFDDGDFDCPGKHATAEECGQPHKPKEPGPTCLRDIEEGPPPAGGNTNTWCICDPSNTVDADVMQITSEAMSWAADSCCDRFKTCGATDKSGTGNYDQCVIEHCNMAWMGSRDKSQCLASVEEAVLKQGQCASVVCPEGWEGEKCDRCQQDRFGVDCSKTCDAATKCSGHGQCSKDGECQCEEGWGFSEEVGGETVYCLHDCRGLSKEKCAGGTSLVTCQWITGTGKCEPACKTGFYGKDCTVKCSAISTCSGHGSCDATGKCKCEAGYEGEACDESFRECTVSGRLHVSSFPETNKPAAEIPADQAESLVELFRTPGEVKVPSTGGGPTLRENYGVTATTYQCGTSRCIRSIAIYSGAALQSVEIWANGTFVKGSACQGKENAGECNDVCGTLACSPDCGKAQDIDKMKNQGFFDSGAYPIPGFGPPTDQYGKALRITNVDKKAGGILLFTLEVPGVMSVRVVAGADNGRSMDVTVRQTVTGLQGYGGACAGTSVPAFKTWVCPNVPVVPPPPSCDSTEVVRRVSKCCDQYKGCAGDAVYKECKEDECALGSGDQCLTSFHKRAATQGCACWPKLNVVWEEDLGLQEGGACTKCADNYFGESCEVFCTAEVTCSGHGACNGKGACDCEDSWEDVEQGGVTMQCSVQKGCAKKEGAAGWQVQSPDWACSDAYGDSASNTEKVKPVGQPTKRGTVADCKSMCEADPKCVQIDWWPEMQLCGIYHLPATGCTGDTFFAESEMVVSGEAYKLSRAAPDKCDPPAMPKCFAPGEAHVESTSRLTTFTVRGVGEAPCSSDCSNGEIAGIRPGKTCAQATSADVLFRFPAYYRKTEGGGVRVASGEAGTADYQLCYIAPEGCPPWQPVQRQCAKEHFSPPACTSCERGYGPEGSCKVQCTREATCSGHGTCDFSNPTSPCQCDDFGETYYVNEGGEQCVGIRTRIPTPPPPCGQEDCTGHAETVTGSKPTCSCACRNKWKGQFCSVCPAGWDPDADCSRCKAGRTGDNCEITCDLEAMCGVNGDAIYASARGCTCSCRDQWLFEDGKGCTKCPPEFDQTTCAACKDPSAEYPVCALACSVETHCVAANTASVKLDGGICSCMCKNQWSGPRCEVCPAQYTGAACDQCAAGTTGTPPQCKACSVDADCGGRAVSVSVGAGGKCECKCRNFWQADPETGAPCSSCPLNFDMFETDCAACDWGYVLNGDKCVKAPPAPCTNQGDCNGNAQNPSGVVGDCTCQPCRNFWSGADCSECDRTKYGGADCDECAKGFAGKPPNCVVCSTETACSGHGRAATVVDGVCRCTCADFWEGDDCSQCPSLYTPATCSSCKTGSPPLCGASECSVEQHCHGHATAAKFVQHWAGDFPISLCECTCRNEWGGSNCEECPASIGGDDCNMCAQGYHGVPGNCQSCSSYCQNNALRSDSEGGKCKCTCSGKWQGDDCTKCPPNMDTSCEICVSGYSWDELEGGCTAAPGSQPAGLTAEVGKLPCNELDCVVHKGDTVRANVTGTDSAAPASTCQQARCPAGSVRIVKKGAACDDANKVLAEAAAYTTAERPADRVTDEFEAGFEGAFRVCYKEEGGSSFRPVPKRCPVNFERDADGECSRCVSGWYGSDCRVFCSVDYTCHGHGRCTPALGTCECENGWKDTTEKEGFTKHSTQACFSPTGSDKETSPFFVPITADAEATDGGDKVKITLKGTGSAPAGCNDLGDKCADGSVLLVKDTGSASCNAPRDSDILSGPIPVSTTSDGERVTDGDVAVDFDAKNTRYLVCYQPESDKAPVPAQVPNVRGAAPSDGSTSGGGGGGEGMMIAGSIALVAGLAGVGATAYVAHKKAARRRYAEDASMVINNNEQFLQEGAPPEADFVEQSIREDV